MTAKDQDLEQANIKEPQQKPVTCSSPPQPMAALGWVDSKALQYLPAVSFVYMTYSSLDAVYKSWPDPGTIGFVAGTYTILLLLFWCMHALEGIREKDSPAKGRLKIAIWLLAMMLNFMFSYRVTVLLDSTVMSVVVWTVATLTAVAGCYTLFF